ncbi:MAG: hypothetical protein ACOH5I_18350 [Oligoflexus sp.]
MNETAKISCVMHMDRESLENSALIEILEGVAQTKWTVTDDQTADELFRQSHAEMILVKATELSDELLESFDLQPSELLKQQYLLLTRKEMDAQSDGTWQLFDLIDLHQARTIMERKLTHAVSQILANQLQRRTIRLLANYFDIRAQNELDQISDHERQIALNKILHIFELSLLNKAGVRSYIRV